MSVAAPGIEATAQLHAARAAEKQQALFYRALAALAEDIGDADLSERLNGMHADEQHHLSRLTVRLLELGESVTDLSNEPTPHVELHGWEDLARARERAEIERYERLLEEELDTATGSMIHEFMAAEHGHAATLGGKWMGA